MQRNYHKIAKKTHKENVKKFLRISRETTKKQKLQPKDFSEILKKGKTLNF